MAHGPGVNNDRRTIKLLFLGQCLHYGYPGVEKSRTFPKVAASLLRARFPGLSFRFDLKYLHHPRGLRALLKHRLLLTRPDIAVISVPALFAATHWRVNLIYQIAPEVVDTARSFLRNIEARIKRDHPCQQYTLLDRTFAWHSPVPLDEYERLVEEAIECCRRRSHCRLVLMGPGRFNEDTIEDYTVHSPELWSAVNQMVLRLGRRLDVPVINAQEKMADHGGEVFIPNNHRWSIYGHEVVAREVESVLASQVRQVVKA